MDRATAWKTRAVHPAQLGRQRQRVYHTVWTPQTAPTRSTGTLFTLEHDATGRISSTRCDTDGRELTDERRCAPTSVHVRRNLRSRSPESVFTFTEIAIAGDTRLVKEVLGHSDTRMTERYTLGHVPEAMRLATSRFEEHLGAPDAPSAARKQAAGGAGS